MSETAPHMRARGRLNATLRHHPGDVETIEALRQELRDANAEDYVRDLVAKAPPLSDAQRMKLASILLSPPNDGDH